MKVNALDHVNIITADLPGTARFYAELFGLDQRDGPPPLAPDQVQWMYDDAGHAIFHLNSMDCPRFFDRDVAPGPTGALHHVALNCSGFDEMIARLNGRAMAFEVNRIDSVGLRQIFAKDPNDVLLELNFWSG